VGKKSSLLGTGHGILRGWSWHLATNISTKVASGAARQKLKLRAQLNFKQVGRGHQFNTKGPAKSKRNFKALSTFDVQPRRKFTESKAGTLKKGAVDEDVAPFGDVAASKWQLKMPHFTHI